ncbi:hypothetical protein [Bacillus cereus]|uniref:Uncharacterized protein n=1 Tax=Bacillus cereus HuA3-9 TaxID=1053205 RepID=R8CII1_BACCE|nr:hypothetical protein [Bacillus cereus]EOO11373.1 hypothetical protein IGA_05636 [Bacillus cereus HuA3-9]
MYQFLTFEIFGMQWWLFLLWIVYVIFTLVNAFGLYSKYHYYTKRQPFPMTSAIRQTFFEREYFTLYDLLRTPLVLPAIVLGVFVLFLQGCLKKFLKVKLFKFKS